MAGPADKIIYHMADAATWSQQKAAGYPGSADDQRDGFIHFSTAATVRESAAKHRTGVEGLVLLAVPVERVADALKWEEARGGVLFPHLFRALHATDVESETPLPLDGNGLHVFPEGIA